MNAFILLQQSGGPSMYGNIILILGIIVIFYFFMIRPQQRRQKEQKKFIDEVKRGDYVVTIGGIHGRIFAIEGDTIVLEVEKGGKLRIDKTAISLESTKRVKDKVPPQS
ncbi:MAG TPA: preprotein translocase subunit YajC [Cyclobacteriaceae bacterium]|nr:preprotein translocase subunit YajC [Cyclobacteriaceae bacterium]